MNQCIEEFTMKVTTKVLYLRIIAILLVIILGYHSYTNTYAYNNFVEKLNEADNLTAAYYQRSVINRNINSDIWRAVYLSSKNLTNEVQSIHDELNKYTDQNYYNSTTSNSSSDFAIYLNAAKQVMNSLSSSNLENSLNIFQSAFNGTAAENNHLYAQLHDLNIENQKISNSLLKESFNKSLIIIIAVILICSISIYTHFSVFSPLNSIIQATGRIIHNNYTEPVPFTDRGDFLGDLAKTIELLRITNLEKEKFEAQSKIESKNSEDIRRSSTFNLSNNFETSVKDIVDVVASAVEKMNITSKELGKLTANTQNETALLSTTSLETKANIEEVSKATAEFSSAANEISTQVTNSLEYARRAAEQTNKINTVVLDLETKASAVSGIIDIINNITSQIDLLALNATIEAARAGEMGKGFAVVANEVKALATQTSKATEQINFQVSGIQLSTSKAVASIQEITESVKTINQNSESITEAVKKQNTTSSFIADSMSKVASMFNSVSSSIDKVSSSSNHYGNTANQIMSVAEDLSKQSNILQNEVNKFLSNLKLH